MPALLIHLGTLALGITLGGLGGLFGIGGGLIAIPVLGLAYGMTQQLAQGTALVMVVPNVLLGFVQYRRRFGVDLRIAITLGVSAVPSTYLAARFATGLDTYQLRRAFAVFMIILVAHYGYRIVRPAIQGTVRRPLPWGWSAFIGVLGGALSGVFGVGGAFLAPPALTTLFGMSQVVAQGLALALVAPGTVVALATYEHAGQVDWATGIPLAIGGVIGIYAGVAAAHRLSERWLRAMFCGLLMATACALLSHS